MEFVDVMPAEEWAVSEEELYQLCGLNVHVYDQTGKHITSHEGWANKLCPVIRSSSEGLMTVCSIAHQNIAARAQKSKSPVLSECDAGLLKFVVPIFWEEEFLGSIGACGYRLQDEEVETFLIHKLTNENIEDLERMAAEVMQMSEGKATELMYSFQERLYQEWKAHNVL